jgi:tRNA A37 threonylcarbamoyladenosine synthetase subunit TsaC/SUA5/YrdC
MNDPLIVHVDSYENAMPLVEIDEDTKKIYKLLAQTYWPGPLTIVTKANDKLIPPTVTAGTCCVGIRCPNNKV